MPVHRANLEEAMSRHWNAWDKQAKEAVRRSREVEEFTKVPLADERARVSAYKEALQQELNALYTDDDARLFAHSNAISHIAQDFEEACAMLRKRADALYADAVQRE